MGLCKMFFRMDRGRGWLRTTSILYLDGIPIGNRAGGVCGREMDTEKSEEWDFEASAIFLVFGFVSVDFC
jgi:hypothetical protein